MDWKDWDPAGYSPHVDTALRIDRAFHDSTWHNDICPSYMSHDNRIRVWLDFKDPAKREMGGKRYAVCLYAADGGQWLDVLSSDDFADVLAAVSFCRFAIDALPLDGSDDEYGSERQEEAANEFSEVCERELNAADWAELERYWLKATIDEAVDYAIKLRFPGAE